MLPPFRKYMPTCPLITVDTVALFVTILVCQNIPESISGNPFGLQGSGQRQVRCASLFVGAWKLSY